MKKNSLNISTSSKKDLYSYWVEFMYPIHKLSPINRSVLSAYLYNLDKIKKSVNDDFILKILTNEKTFISSIASDCDLSFHRVQVSIIDMYKKSIFLREKSPEKKNKYLYTIKKSLIPKIDNEGITINIKLVYNG